MFFQANVNMYFSLRLHVKWVGNFLWDTIQGECNEKGLEEEDDDEDHDQHELYDHVPEEDVEELVE